MDFYEVFKTKVGEKIKNDFCENWIKVGNEHPAYKQALEFLLDTIDNEECARHSKIQLDDVVECNNGEYYIACYSGGLNGGKLENKWVTYVNGIGQLFKRFKDSWMINLENDCLDDIWYLSLAFKITNNESI